MSEDVGVVVANLPPDSLRRLASMRILFGHQSVGEGVVAGLRTLLPEAPSLDMRIVATDDVDGVEGPVFAHFRVGRNEAPDSKLDAFAERIARSRTRIDVAFFKFCFVDVRSREEAESLFERYRNRMAGLKARFPATTFVHVTLPVIRLDMGLKRLAKRLLGRPTGEQANIALTRYNELLRAHYAGSEPVFDLAAVESTRANGSRFAGTERGRAFEALRPDLTDDGEHLNAVGGRAAAAALLAVLSGLQGGGESGR